MDTNENADSRNLKLLREQRKLVEAKVVLENLKIQKNASSTKIKAKEFCLYILPALLQVSAAVIGLIILIKSNFFDASSRYLDAKNIELKNYNDSLSGRKTALDQSVKRLEKSVQSGKIQYAIAIQAKSKVDSANSSLSKTNLVLSGQINQFTTVAYQDAIDNYLNGVYWINIKQIKALKDICQKRLAGHAIIRSYLVQLENKPLLKKQDTIQFYANKVKVAILKYFCFKEVQDKLRFKSALNNYLTKFNYNNPHYQYDTNFLNILINNEWSLSEINENMNMLIQDRYYGNNPFKLLQVYEWATFFASTNYANPALVKTDYQSKIHTFLLKELAVLAGGSNDLDLRNSGVDYETYRRHIQRCQIVLLTECPQAYFALEARVFRENYKFLTSVKGKKIRFVLNLEVDPEKEKLIGDTTMALIKLGLLIRPDFIRSNSMEIDKFMKTLELNKIPNPYIGDTKDSPELNTKYFEFWEKHNNRLEYWLSNKRSADFNSPSFTQQIRTLKL